MGFEIVKLIDPPVQLTFTGGVNWHTSYDNGHAYITGDGVPYEGSAYINIQPCTGILPTNPAYWQVFVEGGIDGAEAFVYIAYASSDAGDGFTLTFNPALDYIAIKETTVEIPSPVVGDFVGLWKKYKGEPGVGEGGQGIPIGGTTGQPFVKNSGADYDTKWGTLDDIPDGTGYVKTENNYDDAAVSKLSGIEEGAQVNDPETDPVFSASEAASFETGDKSALDDAVDDVATLTLSDLDRNSEGLVSGGGLSLSGGLAINIEAGWGWLLDASQLKKVTWDAFNSQVPPLNQYNFVAIAPNGSLNWSATDQGSGYIRLGHVYKDAGTGNVDVIWSTPEWIGDYQKRNNIFLSDIFGTVISYGFQVTEQVILLKISVAAGSLYSKLSNFPYGIKTSFIKIFNSTSGLATDLVNNNSTVDTTIWNDATQDPEDALVVMTADYWAKAIFFISVGGDIQYCYPQAEYETEDEAKGAPIPYADIFIGDGNALLATVVFKEGDSSIANRLYDIRPTMRRAFGTEVSVAGGTVIDHGSLTGLNDDDHPQYFNETRGDARYEPLKGADDNYVTDVEKTNLHAPGSDNQDLSGLVPKSLFDANTIIYATTDDTPVALPVVASTIVGRKAMGDIVALSKSEAQTVLNVADGATANTKATGEEINTGTDDVKFATPKAIADSNIAFLSDIPAAVNDQTIVTTDNVVNNVSTTKHGWMVKSPNTGGTTCWFDDGTWKSPGAASVPEIVQNNMIPAADLTIAANYCVVIANKITINSGRKITINAGGRLMTI